MATLTEQLPHAGGFLIEEGNGDISREEITVASGEGKLRTGTVLAKLSATGKHVAYDNAGTDGFETASAILFDDVDATSADAAGVAIVRLATVNTAELTWKTGLVDADKAAGLADLAALNVIAR